MKQKFDTEKFTEIFKDVILNGDKIMCQHNIREAIAYVSETYSYDILKSITAVDTGDDSIELTYRLYSTENEEEILLSTIVRGEAPSVSDIYASAIAEENEIYDMFGIVFIGNDDLKRLYMPESWEGYPLKKDYIENDSRLVWNDSNENNA